MSQIAVICDEALSVYWMLSLQKKPFFEWVNLTLFFE